MKTIEQILTFVIAHDTALHGFKTDDLPQAAKARVQNTLVSLERYLLSKELAELERWTGGTSIFDTATVKCSQGECCYYVFPDGSLYFKSSGDSEVWAFVTDFADERILRGYSGQLDAMDVELLKHLGGRYAEEVVERN